MKHRTIIIREDEEDMIVSLFCEDGTFNMKMTLSKEEPPSQDDIEHGIEEAIHRVLQYKRWPEYQKKISPEETKS